MIQEEQRSHVIKLIREYKNETGKEATSGGKVSKHFQKWRHKKKMINDTK